MQATTWVYEELRCNCHHAAKDSCKRRRPEGEKESSIIRSPPPRCCSLLCISNCFARRLSSSLASASLLRAMISWIFSSCESISSTLRTCMRLMFSRYPRLMTSSNAASSVKAWLRISRSSAARHVSETMRAIRCSVSMS